MTLCEARDTCSPPQVNSKWPAAPALHILDYEAYRNRVCVYFLFPNWASALPCKHKFLRSILHVPTGHMWESRSERGELEQVLLQEWRSRLSASLPLQPIGAGLQHTKWWHSRKCSVKHAAPKNFVQMHLICYSFYYSGESSVQIWSCR